MRVKREFDRDRDKDRREGKRVRGETEKKNVETER